MNENINLSKLKRVVGRHTYKKGWKGRMLKGKSFITEGDPMTWLPYEFAL